MGKIITLSEAEASERAKQCEEKIRQLLIQYRCGLSVRQTFTDGVCEMTEYRVVPNITP